MSVNERNKHWSQYILDKLDGLNTTPPDEDSTACQPSAHGICKTHGQTLEECHRDNKDQ